MRPIRLFIREESPSIFATRPGCDRDLRAFGVVRKVITCHPKGAGERNCSPASSGTTS
jgi:hypothetical protein